MYTTKTVTCVKIRSKALHLDAHIIQGPISPLRWCWPVTPSDRQIAMNAGSAVYYSWLNFSLLCNVRERDIVAGLEMAGSELEVDVPKKNRAVHARRP